MNFIENNREKLFLKMVYTIWIVLFLYVPVFFSIGAPIATNGLTWSDQTYHIHELPVGSKVNVEEAINFYHPEERDRINDFVQRGIKEGKSWDSEFRLITAKGNNLWVRAIGRILFSKDGSLLAAQGSFQDITQQKKSELAKDTFLATVSHEMRTPLTAIIGMSELLQQTQLTPKQSEYSSGIKNGGDALLTIINDILDLSKLESDALSLKERARNLKQLVQESIDILTPSAF